MSSSSPTDKIKNLQDAVVIMWIDYGVEGWKPRTYGDIDSALQDIMCGNTHEPFVLTFSALKLGVVEDDI